MSSGGGGYSVAENRARLERERQAAVARTRVVEDRLRRLEAKLKARRAQGKPAAVEAPTAVARPHEGASTQEHSRWARGLEAQLTEAEDLLARVQNAERAAALGAHLSRLASSGQGAARYVAPDRAAQAGSTSPAAAASTAAEAAARLARKVEELVFHLSPNATDMERAVVEDLAEQVVKAGPVVGATLLTELKVRVQ